MNNFQTINKRQISNLFPKKEEIRKLFWVILVGTNFFAFLGFAYSINTLVRKFSIWEIIIILAYILSYALLDCISISIVLVIVSLLLPKTWFRDQLSRIGSLTYILGTVFLYPWIGFTSRKGFTYLYFPVKDIHQRIIFIALWVAFNGLIIFLVARILRKESAQKAFDNAINRISVLSMLYLAIDCFSIIIVLIRLIL